MGTFAVVFTETYSDGLAFSQTFTYSFTVTIAAAICNVSYASYISIMSTFYYYIYDETGGDKTITTYNSDCDDETPVDVFSWKVYGASDDTYSTEMPSNWVHSVTATNFYVKSTDTTLDNYRIYLRQVTTWASGYTKTYTI